MRPLIVKHRIRYFNGGRMTDGAAGGKCPIWLATPSASIRCRKCRTRESALLVFRVDDW